MSDPLAKFVRDELIPHNIGLTLYGFILNNIMLDDLGEFLETSLTLYIVETWTMAISFLICDLVVIWRASTMYPHRRAVRFVLWMVAMVDAVLLISLASLTSRDVVQQGNSSTTYHLTNDMTIFSLIATLVGTGAIAIAAWRQRRFINRASFFKGNGAGAVPRWLLVLVETGAFWALVQLVFCILQQITFTKSADATAVQVAVAANAIGNVARYMAAILATATALIVRSQRSLEDMCSIGAFSESASVLEEGRVATGGPLLQQVSRMSRDTVSQAGDEDVHGFDTQAPFGALSSGDGDRADSRGIAQQLRAMAERAAFLLETQGQTTTRFSDSSLPDYRSQYTVGSGS
ncbi:hypothetical protein C8R44DRAFT_734178 [Mycena epipterygia]|nr:hypothetical protein C8R44DRAFT_734178 [Mycena epipterygia]